VQMNIELADGHMGFPGRLLIEAHFSLTDDAALDIRYRARTDQTTLCNLAHHSYFILDDSGDILGHELQVFADHYTPVDEDLIPTGQITAVAGTAFDFRSPRRLQSADESHPAIDHNFCLSRERVALRPIATLTSQESSVQLQLSSTEAGLQVFDSAPMAVPVPGLDGRHMGAYAGLALEPQVWPDSPNQAAFPQAILRPGERYEQHTRYTFSRL